MTRNYALLDKDRRVVNVAALDLSLEFSLPEGVVGFAPYDGPFIPGEIFGSVGASIPAIAPTVLPQDLMAQFTVDDASKIQAAIAANVSFWLLWSAMQAQKDAMRSDNPRFVQGWGALEQVLGLDRMNAIAKALGIKT